jgi:hypothetical protein
MDGKIGGVETDTVSNPALHLPFPRSIQYILSRSAILHVVVASVWLKSVPARRILQRGVLAKSHSTLHHIDFV